MAVSFLCLFLAVPWDGLWSVTVAFPGHTHLLSHDTVKPVPGRIAQSVTCLATDASLTADPGVAS